MSSKLPSFFESKFLFVPFAVQRINIVFNSNEYSRTVEQVGYAVYRVFGFRIVLVQETKPWE